MTGNRRRQGGSGVVHAWQEGLPTAKICIVAEAPAKTEINMDQPLVGQSGQIFNWCLQQAKLYRGSLYILNVFPFQVYKKDSGKKMYDMYSDTLLWDQKGFTDDGEEAANQFFENIRGWQGTVLMPMGNTALYTVCGKLGIEKWRGSPIRPTDEDREILGCPNLEWIIPTLHPAATLEHRGRYEMRHVIKTDLEKAKRYANGYKQPERELIIDPSFGEVMDYMGAVMEAPYFCSDTEIFTNRRCISCFSLAVSPWSAISIPLLDGNGNDRWSFEEELRIWQAMATILDREDATYVNQNILFDLWIYWIYQKIFPRCNIADPMIAQGAMFPDFPKNLGFMASVHTDIPYYKDEGGRAWFEGKGDAKDIERFWRYNALDAAGSLETWIGNDWTPGLETMLKEEGYTETYQLGIQRIPALLYMMSNGMLVDQTAWEKSDAEVTRRIRELKAELQDEVGRPLNIGSPKQCKEYFYDECGRKPYVNRMTGRPTTDDKALARIVRSGGMGARAAEITLELRARETLKKRYLDMDWDDDGRLRCSLSPAFTITGRLSSSKTVHNTGGNMQNLPGEFRSFLVADEE